MKRVVLPVLAGGVVVLLGVLLLPLAFGLQPVTWLPRTTSEITTVCGVDGVVDREVPANTGTTITPVPDGKKGVDVPYLDGNSYLRGINMYDLEARRKVDTSCALNNPQESYTYLASRGMKIIRLAVPWQRLQPVPENGDFQAGMNGGLDRIYLSVVQTEIQLIENAGMRVILDLHNGGTYPSGPGEQVPGTVAFGNGISIAQAQHIWGMLSQTFKDEPGIAAYDIFNEVSLTDVSVQDYKTYTRAVVDTIRSNGDQHTLWVEGMQEMTPGRLPVIASSGPWISDPLDRIVYSQHFYPGGTGSVNGVYDSSKAYSSFVQQLTDFGEWCEKFDVHCSVGEVGWPATEAQPDVRSPRDNWSILGEKFYKVADRYKLDVTYFASTNGKKPGWLNAYVSSDGLGIDTAWSQASVIERHPTQ